MYLDFEVVVFLPISARKWAKHKEGLVERQMMNVMNRIQRATLR